MTWPVLVAVPGGVGARDVRERLETIGLSGWVIDGAALGWPGWTLARLVGDDDSLLVSGPFVDEGRTTTATALAALLESRWPGVQVGDVTIDGRVPLDLLALSPDLVPRTVAVTPPADLMLGFFAKGTGATLHEARVDDQLLVGADVSAAHVPVDDEELPHLPDDLLVDALVNARGVSVVLWRRGRCTGLHVLRRGKQRAVHVWEPRWTPFGDPDVDELRAELTPAEGDASVLAGLLAVADDDVVALRAMLRRDEPDLPALTVLLGLPTEVVDVLEGRTTVADLPGAEERVPQSWRETLAAASRSSEHDPRWIQAVDRGARELRPWYLASSLVWLAACGWAVADWRSGGSTFWGVVGLVGGLGQLVDLAVRWVQKRRRARG